ncbi:FKBP-type peptidylprolyl isomerase [Spirosoma taeanense]|uniref:Peptidyl-prolyl cis-trans isomerase n=1 Tax=Spirosoma taeanense TaxID=2735870 RepID=A0A6M5Y5R4_9BACT|nr:FKBP-type peptidyl-prolyl cis-trans isomerase [Spirosoma taeanense]QJW88032.1 FKBP-type peptidylprolyl isomerase [Spirosoma taeanense]
MRLFQLSICSALLMGSLESCTQSIDPSSTYYDQNDADIQAYVSQNNLQGTLRSTGLYYVVTTPNPTGKQATTGEEIEFTYKSYNLKTGQVVDSSAANRPVYYPLGIGSILPGLEEGLSLMREGERSTLLIPSYLAYSDKSKTNLPAYSVIRFDVRFNRSRSEEQQIEEYIAVQKFTNVEKTASGLRFIKTKDNPTGATPTTSQTLTIKYAGKQLRSVTPFDSTGSGTFDAVLGQSKYVKGFEEGLAKLKVGEKATIIFPSSLGYGATGVVQNNTYVITPYAPLRFDLEVISAK